MEKFEGIGAACIARFHEAGMAGRIMWGEREVAQGRGKGYSSWFSAVDPWLLEKCTYTPPEPVWRDATNREALLAYLIDKGEVEYQITEDAPIEMDRAWHKVTTDYTAWTDPYRRYRIREDA